ncbi:ESX secretion-associated protein EspG [Nocardia miyunensis]|uniref:ESX secretion-associated protein EspG n=1 Tax=Nocardia miyunensis TaxID=282684 RepID=UPI0008347BC2|nr:ESX secretion-associated protein EspG [Nocardia miyunensis]
MPRSTRFTGLEFEILWAAYGRDRMPYPLQHRTDIEDFDDLKRAREAAVESLLTKYDPDLDRALAVLVNPDARVEAMGFGGPDHDRIYRFHGAVRDNGGAVMVQFPGTAPDSGGDVIVKYCPATQIGEYAVESLPKRKPGTHPALEIRRDDLERDRLNPVRHGPSLTDRLDRIFDRPRTAYGEVMIFPGPALDARRSPGRSFWWMDYPDGRYYVKTTDPIIAKPITPKSLAAEVNRLTTLTATYYRDDREHESYLRTRRP